MKLNERLRQLRAKRGWSLETAASELGISRTQLVAYEAYRRKKKNNPRYERLWDIAIGYGLSDVSELMKGVQQYE